MTIGLIGEFHAVPERPGMRTRALIATEHGFTSLFVAEFEMGQGASVPLHTHPIEEGFVVTDGALTIQLGEETMTATAGSVVRIPPGCPTRFVIRRSIRHVFSAQRRIEQTSSERLPSILRAFHGKSENLRSGSACGPMRARVHAVNGPTSQHSGHGRSWCFPLGRTIIVQPCCDAKQLRLPQPTFDRGFVPPHKT